MGIKNLSKFLKETFPHLFETIHISEYHYRLVAIDTSLYLCNYKAAYQDHWLGAFIKLVSCLRENEIHCVFIYDSGYPQEKMAEKKERSENRSKLEDRVFALEEAIEKYHCTGQIDPILIDFQNKRKISQPKLLLKSVTINIKEIEYQVKKMRSQLFQITQNDFDITKKLFDILQVPYFNSPLEAETLCADLCIQGKVDAVLSEDTDVLAYGAPIFLTKMNTKDGTCLRIKHAELLTELGLTTNEFLDFCIMCGTDYNKNIPKIGPKKAYQLVSTHHDIDSIAKNTIFDISILNHRRVRQLFTEYSKSKAKIPYCGCPNMEELQIFIEKHRLRISVDNLEKSFVHKLIIFEDEGEMEEPDEKIILENTK